MGETGRREVDLNSLPGGGSVVPGESLVFQAWFQDGGPANYSTSNTATIVFQ